MPISLAQAQQLNEKSILIQYKHGKITISDLIEREKNDPSEYTLTKSLIKNIINYHIKNKNLPDDFVNELDVVIKKSNKTINCNLQETLLDSDLIDKIIDYYILNDSLPKNFVNQLNSFLEKYLIKEKTFDKIFNYLLSKGTYKNELEQLMKKA